MTSANAGDRVGRYTLVRKLGSGGMGVVWEAVLEGLGGFRRSVALKLLTARRANAEGRRALLQEARLGAMLSHPNVVSTTEVGASGDVWFLAMELVNGPSLRQLGRRLPPSVVLEVGVQVCAGLAHLHGLRAEGGVGLVHRDIKPANLLIDRSGLVKIADLGVARLGGHGGGIAGTLGYAPPEQLVGTEDARADLFALGVVLLRCLTGQPPFGRGAEPVLKVPRADVLVPRLVAGLEPSGLGDVLVRCLRVDPEERYASAAELASALRSLRARLAPGSPTLVELLQARRDDVQPVEGGAVPTVVLALGNLPRRPDRYIGRGDALSRLEGWLRAGGGLITVLGLGGLGKTRLATEAARGVAPELRAGAWFVDLEAATSEADVVAAVAATVGIPETSDGDPVARVGHALAARGPMVLVLDNLEQVVEGAAGPVARWRSLAPACTLLCTSRVALGVQGERVLSLEPLTLAEGLELFRDRAEGPLTDENAADVELLVSALDGLPLAIELAAARTRLLRVGAIRARLDQRLRLLAGGGRDRPERHRSLRASMDGSWELLDDVQRSAMAQLTVFVEGFDVEAAEAVLDLSDAPDAPWAVDVVDGLVGHSLVRYEREARRFVMLPLVREYAGEHLTAEARRGAEARHAAWFACMGSDEALAILEGVQAPAAFARLAAERGNLLIATARAADVPSLAVPLLRASWRVLERQGPPAVGEELARSVLAMPLGDLEEARALHVLGMALEHRGALADAEAAFQGGVSAAVRAGAKVEEARGHVGLGRVLWQAGKTDEGLGAFRRGMADFRSAGEVEAAARTGGELGQVLLVLGRSEEGRALTEEALAVARASGDRATEAQALSDLAGAAKSVGDAPAYLGYATQALALCRELGDRRQEGQRLNDIALAHVMLGDSDRALEVWEDARGLHAEVGDRRGEAVLLGNVAMVYDDLGQYARAMEAYEACLARTREMGAVAHEANTLQNMAITQRAQGRTEEALAGLEAALSMHRRLGNRRSEGIALGLIGGAYRDQGDAEQAITLMRAALDLHREVGNRRSEGITLGNLGAALEDIGRTEEARRCFEEALALHRDVGNRNSEGYALYQLGRLLHRQGKTEQGIELMVEAVSPLEQAGRLMELLQCTSDLAVFTLEAGDETRARNWLEVAESLSGRLSEPDPEVTSTLADLRERLA